MLSELEEEKVLHKICLLIGIPFPSTLTSTDLIKGECMIPEDILLCLRSLIRENDPRTAKSTCVRKSDSFTQDLVYTC